MGEIRLDWQSARVKDGTLTVPLDGKAAKDWRASFERTAKLLNHGTWKDVELKKGKVHIKPVDEDDVERVRHFLESLVLEANSETAPPEETEGANEKGAAEEADETDSADAKLTATFRAFGETNGEGGEPDGSGQTA